LKSETIWSGDASYIIRHPLVRSRISVFYTEFHDQVWNRSYYLDQYRSFVNFVMKDIDKVHAGVEFGADVNLSPTLQMNVAAGYGEYFYNSRPKVTITRDNNREVLAQDRLVYAKNYRIGGMPQTAATTGMRYNHPKYWFAGFNANYMTNIYMDFSPERRTEKAVENYIPTDPQWDEIIPQEVHNGGFTLDVYGGKSWRIRKYGHFINLNLSITNLLDNNNMVIGGFEQLRFKATDVDAFPNKYFYMYGRNFFVNLTYRW
jgi:outer membrane receptor protein involved in Fe transport